MQPSDAVREAMLHLYDRLSASDVASFDDVVDPDAALIIGTAPGEWVTERDGMRFGFEPKECGSKPVGRSSPMKRGRWVGRRTSQPSAFRTDLR